LTVHLPLEPSTATLLRLVQLCDSALPVGAYSQSWGLETAIARGEVSRPQDVDRWVRSWLIHNVAPGEGVAVAHAARRASAEDWESLRELNELLTAGRPVTSIRRASLQQGEAMLNLASGWPWSGWVAASLRATDPGPWHHAVVFGALATAAGASPPDSVALYLQNAANGVVSASVRGVPIGHTHGQQILARLQPLLGELSAACSEAPIEQFGGLSPAYEVACHAQTRLHTRIFQS
jgi:urease accessory protein